VLLRLTHFSLLNYHFLSHTDISRTAASRCYKAVLQQTKEACFYGHLFGVRSTTCKKHAKDSTGEG
jgi:hypothetical protein